MKDSDSGSLRVQTTSTDTGVACCRCRRLRSPATTASKVDLKPSAATSGPTSSVKVTALSMVAIEYSTGVSDFCDLSDFFFLSPLPVFNNLCLLKLLFEAKAALQPPSDTASCNARKRVRQALLRFILSVWLSLDYEIIDAEKLLVTCRATTNTCSRFISLSEC